ncbi:DUF3488 domain-containing protein [Frankia sp. Cj5]|uniref:DUF3488 domain-containing protein n=1 Tax=Frankia sp. Cj5 TaxID=2880978 RepID=UPI001EF59588|nr:hypothetical protein [Frankia sp. Cj5]
MTTASRLGGHSSQERIVPAVVEAASPLRPTGSQGERGPGESSARQIARCIAAVGPLLAGTGLWAASLPSISTYDLDDYGLSPRLGLLWYTGLAVLLVGAAANLCRRWMSGTVAGGYLVALATALYGTIPLIVDEPRYAWTYKHIGVIRYIELHGSVDWNIDIYHRWPGFFATAGFFSVLGDRPDPTSYAAWAELFFTLVNVVLVIAIARVLLHDNRIAWTAATIFVVTNWVGQSYFAPQAFGYTLTLGLMLILVWQFSGTHHSVLGSRVSRCIHRCTRRPVSMWPAPTKAVWPRSTAIAILLFLDFAIVASHQLTPYILAVQAGVLVLLGMLRPRWLVAAFLLIMVAFLLPHLSYVNQRYGLFTDLNPLANSETVAPNTAMLLGKTVNIICCRVLVLVLALMAVSGAIRLLRRSDGRAVALFLLATTPAFLIFGQSYGGEAILRVVLFALPWCAILGAVACTTAPSGVLPAVRGSRRYLRVAGRYLLVAATLLTCAALFVPAYFGQDEINFMTHDQLAATHYLYTHGQPGSVIMNIASNAPVRSSANYNLFLDESLLRREKFQHRPLGAADIDDVVAAMHAYAPSGYLVFAPSTEEFARVFQLTPPGAVVSLEHAIAESGFFTPFYVGPDTRIYALRPIPASPGSTSLPAAKPADGSPGRAS